MSLSWLFGIIFSFIWYIVRPPLVNFTIVNDGRRQERIKKSIHQSITRYWEKPDT